MLSRSKIEYMECHFSGRKDVNPIVVKLGDKVISKSDCFRYLESIIHNNAIIEEDVNQRIQAGWAKWRSV